MDKIALTKRQELVGLLEIFCEQLELTETQRQSAEEKYEAVGKCTSPEKTDTKNAWIG
jgi:hypothetical protein